jgi:hypothetical protein
MAPKSEFKFSVTEVTLTSEKQKRFIRLNVDGEDVRIPVDNEVYAYWQQQFVRPNPTRQQRQRFATLINVVRAAYEKGREDATK